MAEIDVILKGSVEGLSEIEAFHKELKEIQNQQTLMNRESILASARNATHDKLDLQLKKDMQKSLNNSFVRRQDEIKQLKEMGWWREKNAEDHVRFSANGIAIDTDLAYTKEELDMREKSRLKERMFDYQAIGSIGQGVDKAFIQRKQEMMALDQADKQMKAELLQIENSRRQELMQASIGMFVMGITMTQTLTTMEKMAGVGTTLGGVFKEMGQAVRFVLGPIQVVTAAMQFLNQKNKELMMTMIKSMGIFVGMYLLYTAFTTKSKELRMILGFVGGALIAYNALLLVNTARTWYNLHAKAALISLETLGAALPSIILAIGAGLAVGIAAMASAPKGQNAPGYSRPVNNTGLVYAHRGEVISRIGSTGPSGGSTTLININVPESSIVNTDMVDYMTRQLEIIQASGRGG